VVPNFRFNEIKIFAKRGLQDFSISRLKEKMPWGVPVPGDETHVMYVWFDALINYISTLGWPDDKSKFFEYWGTVGEPKALQIAGKDNLRQQTAMWQAMLMAAGLPTSRQIIIHGFINIGGQKMSKSLGNVADPYDIIKQLEEKGLSNSQAIDALRFYLLSEISTFEDGDYTFEHLVEMYNGKLANGLGNLVSRVMKMAVNAGVKKQGSDMEYKDLLHDELDVFDNLVQKFEIQKACSWIWNDPIRNADIYIQSTEPFKTIKTDPKKAKKDIAFLLDELFMVATALKCLLPETAKTILKVIKEPKLENIPKLFPRIEQNE